MNDQNKNLILASVLSFLVIIIWFVLFPPPEPVADPNATATSATVDANGVVVPPRVVGTDQTGAAQPTATETRATALSEAVRIPINSPQLSGSISLTGGRLDDLSLKDYHKTLDPKSEKVTLLSPVGSDAAYYALYGWAPSGDLAFDDVPGANTAWSVESGSTLAPGAPVTLVWDNGKGLVFRRTIEVDDKFMFTVTQSVQNTGTTAQRMAPYGVVARQGEPKNLKGFFIIHEGAIRMSDGTLEEISYKDMRKMDVVPREGAQAEVIDVATDGWIGFTDHYWMTTLIPKPGQGFTSVAKYSAQSDIYQTEARLPTVTVQPGATATSTTQLFAGAKVWSTIRDYQNLDGIQGFLNAIDWGWFFFLTKPIFFMLHTLNSFIGNMGWSIIGLTLLIKAILLPLAYKSYVSMAKMKELQPQMEKLKEKAGDDRQKLQQEMMALYKREKVNPASGCLPILLQIPIFFSLYKVIFVTIELRQAPWIGWIRDLSAPDPSSLYNLWGIFPWAAPEPGSIMATIFIGILPLILGISMWLQQKLNPAPTDPTQAMVFAWMPWVFMFMLGGFASGLVIYWIANNTITFMQQYAIMRSQGYKPDVFGNILSTFKKKKPEKK